MDANKSPRVIFNKDSARVAHSLFILSLSLSFSLSFYNMRAWHIKHSLSTVSMASSEQATAHASIPRCIFLIYNRICLRSTLRTANVQNFDIKK